MKKNSTTLTGLEHGLDHTTSVYLGNFSTTVALVDDHHSSECLGHTSVDDSAGYSLSSTVVLAVLTSLFCVFALLGNVTVIVAIVNDRVISKHKQNLYLLSLAVADALLVVLVVPFSLTNELLGYWPFGDVYCQIYLSVDILLCTASIANICCIGIDRFVSVKHPTTYKKYRKLRRIRLVIASVWLYASAVSLLPFTGKIVTIHGTENECFINNSSWFIILSSTLSFFLPALVIGPVYINIFLIGRRLEAAQRARHSYSHKDGLDCNNRNTPLKPTGVSKGPSCTTTCRSESNLTDVNLRNVMASQTSVEKETLRTSSNLNGNDLTVIQSVGSLDSLRPSRTSMISIDSQTHRRYVNRLKPVVEKESSRNFSVQQSKSHLPELLEEGKSIGHCSDSVFVDSPSPTCTRRSNFSGNFPVVYSRANLYSASSSVARENKRINSLQTSRIFRTCRENFCCLNSNVSTVSVTLAPPCDRQEPSRFSAGSAKGKIYNSISFTSLLRKNSALVRRASAMSNQSCAGPSRREKRFIFIITVVTGCFLLCWSPFFVTYFVYALCRDYCCINRTMFKVFFWIGYLNSGLNPALYTVFNEDFRKAFKRLFKSPCQENSW